MNTILFVCTGNQCRSPMAAALLRSRLAQMGATGFAVESAGFVSAGRPAPTEVVEVMSPLGIDVSGHRSRLLQQELLDGVDLNLVMTRQHLMDLVVFRPEVWPRTFTLAEFVHRAEVVGGRTPGEAVSAWTGRINAGRARAEILNLPAADDVPDPIGGTVKDYERVRDLLVERVRRLAALMGPA
jgi:protein-tyrosine phosphatase